MKVLHKNIINNIEILLTAKYSLSTAKIIAARLAGKAILNMTDLGSHFRVEVMDMGVRNFVRIKKVIDVESVYVVKAA